MPIYVSPGVYSRELDYSFYVASMSTCIVGMVGTAEKGVMNDPTLITSPESFMRNFGSPNVNSLASYAAMEFLSKGNKLYFCRVGGSSAAKSSLDISAADSTPVKLMTISALTEGAWGDEIKITVSNASSVTKTFDLKVYLGTDLKESYVGISTLGTDARYCEDIVNGTSLYITIEDEGLGTGTDVPIAITATALAGGNEGWTTTPADYIGELDGTTKTGILVFSNPEEIDINLIACPGQSDITVHNAMISCCEGRADAMAILDPPMGLDVQGIVDFTDATGTYTTRTALNSSYAAIYWPWVKIYDAYSASYVWVPPSGMVLAQYAYNDSQAWPWYAPAGWNRGKISSAVGIEYSANQGDRDVLYPKRINSIVNFSGKGLVIWGQKTTQVASSAFDRVNVRRMLLYIRKAISTAAVYLAFEQNNASTWNRFINLVDPLLRMVKENKGLYDYMIKMDSDTVTDYMIDTNTMPGKIFLKPTKTAEMIPIDFIIVSTGAKFSE